MPRADIVAQYEKVTGEKVAKGVKKGTLINAIIEKVGTDRAKERWLEMQKTKRAIKSDEQKGKKRGAISEKSSRGFLSNLIEIGALPYTPNETYTETVGKETKTVTQEEIVNKYNETHKKQIEIIKDKDGVDQLTLKRSEGFKDTKGQVETVSLDAEQAPITGEEDVSIETVDFNKLDLKPSEQVELTRIEREGADYDSKLHDSLISRGILEKFTTPDGGIVVDLARSAEEKQIDKDIEDGKPVRLRSKGATRTSESAVDTGLRGKKAIIAMVKTVKRLFPKDNILIEFGSKQNPVTDPNGKVLENFSDDAFGGIQVYDGKPLITINTSKENHDTFLTFLHEAVGHFGAEKVFDSFPEFRKYSESLFKRDKNSAVLKEVQDNYKKEAWFREWVAKHIEIASTEFFDAGGNMNEARFNKADSVAKRLLAKIRDILASFFKMAPTSQEIRDMTDTIFSKVRELSSKKVTVEATGRQKVLDTKPKKFSSETAKKRVKTHDRLNLETAKTVKTTLNRLQKYLINHISSDEEKAKILKSIEKIETIGKDKNGKYIDKNMRDVLKAYDDNAERGDIGRALAIFSKEVNKLKRRAAKVPEKLKTILEKSQELREKVNNWRTLGMLARFGDMKVRTNSKTGEQTVGKTYQELIDKKYIYDPNTVRTKVKKYMLYRLTDKGREYFNNLEKEFKDLKQEIIDEQEGAVVGYESVPLSDYLAIESNKIREELFKFRKLQEGIKTNKDDKTTEEVSQIINQVELDKKDTSKYYKFRTFLKKTSQVPVIGKIYDAIREGDMYMSQSLDYITLGLDRFKENGFFRKHINNKVEKAEERSSEFKRQSKKIVQEILTDVDLTKFSLMFQNGMLNNILNLNPARKESKVPTYKYTDATGKEFSITADQRVSLFRQSRNFRSLKHLLSETGGIALNTKENSPIFKLNPEVLTKIIGDLSADEKLLVKALDAYFEFQKKNINETSSKDLGYELATEQYYHPILTVAGSQRYKETEATLTNVARFAGHMAFNNLKMRSNASNPIVLEGAMEAAARTENMVADYVGKAITMKEIARMFDKETEINGKKTKLTTYMQENGMGLEVRAIKDILKGVEGTDPGQSRFKRMNQTMRFFRTAKTVGVLGYNASVAIIQPMSYFSSGTDHGFKLNFGVGGPAKLNKMFDDFYDNSAFLWDRFNNHLDRDFGEAMSAVMARNTFTFNDKLQALGSYAKQGKLLSAEAAMSLITRMDAGAMKLIINDVAQGVVEKYNVKYGTKEFFDIAIPIFEKTVKRTQPTFATAYRPVWMSNEMLKGFTMFMSQPIKNLQMTRIGVDSLAKGLLNNDTQMIVKGINQLFPVLVVQPLAVALVREAVRGARGKWGDDEEELKEKILKGWLLANLGMYPVIGNILSELINGRSVQDAVTKTHPAFETVSDMLVFVTNFYKAMSGEQISNKKSETNAQKLYKLGIKAASDASIAVNGPNQFLEMLQNTTNMISEATNE